MGCFIPSPPNPCLSLSRQTCKLTSPALMSARVASCSRKLLSGKDTSALGMQLWLPVGRKKHISWVLIGSDTRWRWERCHVHSHELWSRKSPEPSQFRKSPVSARTNRLVKPFLSGISYSSWDWIFFFFFYATVKVVRQTLTMRDVGSHNVTSANQRGGDRNN